VPRARKNVGRGFVSKLVTIGEENAEIRDYSRLTMGWSSRWKRRIVQPMGYSALVV